MEYQNILPDHYFVVGCKHKLITSVIGDMKHIKSNMKKVYYLPLTYQQFSGQKFQREEGDDGYIRWRPLMKTEAYKYYQLVINNRPAVAEFVGEVPLDIIITKSKEFKANHVCQSQYLLPILKRTDAACCSQFQLSSLKIKKGKFLQPLLPAIFSSKDS